MTSLIASMSGKISPLQGRGPWQPLHPTMHWNGRSTWRHSSSHPINKRRFGRIESISGNRCTYLRRRPDTKVSFLGMALEVMGMPPISPGRCRDS
ncbi:MAG: hypothetical protein MZV63_65755 [Marinilabiliales bacterium]|nr:hypothetical protein [Marinilabiliales bacterium]